MRLKFVAPLMPTLVEQPPEGDDWIHEVKFDGYRSQLIIDESGLRIYTRNGHDWTAKYRDLVNEAQETRRGKRHRRWRDYRAQRSWPV